MNFDRTTVAIHGERRKAVRSKVALPALILVNRREKKTRTTNVSLGGLMVQTDEPLDASQKIRVGFLARSCPIEAHVRVIYSFKEGPGYVSGLAFDKISSSDKENLSRYLEMYGPLDSRRPSSDAYQEGEAKTGRPSTDTEVILPESHVSALLIRKGHRKSEETSYEISRAMTSIGRHDDNDIVLRDPSVSGHHAKIRFEDDGYFIYDFASTNGTRVNGQRTYRKRITDGDVIEIGGPAFTFVTKKRRSLSPGTEGD